MAETSLVMLASLAAGALVLGFGALPWLRARRSGHVPPELVLGDRQVLQAGLLMAACLVGCVWLALDAAAAGGLVGQRPLLEQLLPIIVAVVLAGCLVVFAWQPAWVARELRGVAIGLLLAAAALLLLSGTSGVPMAVACVVGAAACLASSRLLRTSASASRLSDHGRARAA